MPLSLTIADEALALQQRHPDVAAVEILDCVLKEREYREQELAEQALPPSPFGLLVAEAFDSAMVPGEWKAWTLADADPRLREGLLSIWRTEVWPRFLERYPLTRFSAK